LSVNPDLGGHDAPEVVNAFSKRAKVLNLRAWGLGKNYLHFWQGAAKATA
jgi:hypothetical protein